MKAISSNITNTENPDWLILQMAETLKDLTNWGRFDSPDEWDKKISAFDRLVKAIPAQHLEACVMHAAQNHKKNKDFAPCEVLESWNEIAEKLARDQAGGHLNRQENLKCPYCRGTGFTYLDSLEGEIKRAVSPCKNRCKAVSDLSTEGEPMPDDIKMMIRTMGRPLRKVS
jgi:hypothetical protein